MTAAIGEIRFADFRRRLRVARAGQLLAEQADKHRRDGLPPMAVIAFDHVGRSVELWGRYEREELSLLMTCLGGHIDRSGLAIDVGANIGNHALFFADHFAEVLAVEPHPRTHAVLALNAALRRNVRCVACALSDQDGTGRLITTEGNSGMARVAQPGADLPEPAVQVPLRRLDGLDEISGRRVALVKIDAEGHEAAVIGGASAVLRRDRPVVVFEQHPTDIVDGTSAAVEALRTCGYRRLWTVEEFPNSGSRMFDALRRRISGAGLRMVEVQRLERRFHSMVVALPEDR